jgi:mannose-6-phosphate isomerase-like protein (cupin superfamily)
MRESIRREGASREFYTAEGCFITEVSNSGDDPNLSVARARVPEGAVTRWHRLRDIEERYLILQGVGLVEAGDMPAQRVEVGDMVLIPAWRRQRIRNIGHGDLVFLALCTPRFRQRAYEDIEDACD